MERIQTPDHDQEERVYIQESQPSPKSCWSRCCTSKCWSTVSIIFFLMLNIVLSVLVMVYTSTIVKSMTPFFAWIQAHPYQGYFIFFVLDTISIPLLLPNVIINLVGGFVFKEAFSFIISLIFTNIVANLAGMIGSGVSFELGRHCCQKCIRKLCINRFKLAKALDHILIKHGIKLIALLRLSPFSPFTALNYAIGTTSITFADYMIGSLAMVVNTFVFVFLGCGLKDISQIINGTYKGSVLYEVILIAGIVISVGLLVVLVFVTKDAVKKLTEEQLKEEEDLSPHEEEALINTEAK